MFTTHPGDAASGARSGVNEVPEPTGSIPWGTSGPDAPLYSADSNPFVIKGNQSENINNPIGAYVTTFSVNDTPSASYSSCIFYGTFFICS